jgi:preprotein translocase subunit SecE
MSDSEQMIPATADTSTETKMDMPHEQPAEPQRPAPGPAPRPSAGGSPLRIYKPGQGTYTRWGTAISAGIIALAGVSFLAEELPILPFGDNPWVQYLVPVAVFAALAIVIFRFVGSNQKFVDFMIATEGEMKKVNWSNKKEIIGATKVVIATVLGLALTLFAVDVFFMFFFSAIKVLRVDLLSGLFGGTPSQ